MSASNEPFDRNSPFFVNLPEDFQLGDDLAQQRLLREYGAVFVARGGVVPPNKVVFKDEADVAEFQSQLDISRSKIGEFTFELQSHAMESLLAAIDDARDRGLSISGRGKDSARRNYMGTVELWASRVEPALLHWVVQGRLAQANADAIRSLSPYEQVPVIFTLEADGIYFAKDLSKSIIYSVAPPGSSQHLSMLAFDVAEFDNADVRKLLADHYWYQTVVSDLPHFTFLGTEARELRERGLKKVTSNEREFWVPDI